MPKNVMKLLKPSPHRERNDFDLSHRHIFSANFGELLPISCIETVPGDHIRFQASDLLRAIPLVTSPFLRAKQHLDVWFVPYRDLWHNFDQFMAQKNEPVSSILRDHSFIPHVSMYELAQCLNPADAGTDIIGRSFASGAAKILNLLGYGDQIYSKFGSSSAATAPHVNLFRIAAYNYIWYNEYRQQYYDDGGNLLPNVLPSNVAADAKAAMLFNFDYLNCSSEVDSRPSYAYIRPCLQMRYRTWKKDLYTGLLPSTQFGNVSTVSLNNIQLKNDADLSSYTQANLSVSVNSNISTGRLLNVRNSGTNVSGSTRWSSADAFDVLALRRSEAVQIWRENSLRAGNHVRDNFLAHYGVASDFQDHRPRYLGSVDAPVNIGDVMTTANSSSGINDTVGDVAGKGLSSLDQKVFSFDSKEFGVIVCMFSLLPETEYNASGIDRMNQLLETEDFFTPEFQNLGLEAVSSQNFFSLLNSNAKVVGYAPRYYGYKTKLDKVFGSFMTGQPNAPWASPNYIAQQSMGAPGTSIPLSNLYVNPAIYDVNFTSSVENGDQFLCDVYFDVDAVRPMSVVGLPFS